MKTPRSDSPTTPQGETAPFLITVEKAAEILNKTTHSTRQLILRGKLKKFLVAGHIRLDIEDVMRYYSVKKHLPAWEADPERLRGKTFIDLASVVDQLDLQAPYLIRLIRNNTLEGYVTSSGNVVINRDSVNQFLRTPDNDSDSL